MEEKYRIDGGGGDDEEEEEEQQQKVEGESESTGSGDGGGEEEEEEGKTESESDWNPGSEEENDDNDDEDDGDGWIGEEEEKHDDEDDEEENLGSEDENDDDEDDWDGWIVEEEEKHEKRKNHVKVATRSQAKYEDCMDKLFPSWIQKALSCINMANARIANHDVLFAYSPPDVCLRFLQKFHAAAMLLMNHTDTAILRARNQQCNHQRLAFEEKLSALRNELERTQARCARRASCAQAAKEDMKKQEDAFLKAKEELTKQETILRRYNRDLVDALNLKEQKFLREKADLERQLEEERDTIILPCLHFQYCFACLLRQRSANSNTCPTCRGPIQGLNMSSCLAS